MKFFAYLSMSTLIGTTAAASSALRGSDGEALAPPRVFNEPHATMETSTGELTSSKWMEGGEDGEYGQFISPPLPEHSSRTLQNCDGTETPLSVTLFADKHSNTDNLMTVSIRQDGSWRELGRKEGSYTGDYTMCLAPGFYKFVAYDSYNDGITNGGGYVVKLDGKEIFSTPTDSWSRVVHKFDAPEISNNVNNEPVEGTPFPTEIVPGPPVAKPTPKPSIGGGQPGTGFPTYVVESSNSAPSPTKKPTPKPSSSLGGGDATAPNPTPTGSGPMQGNMSSRDEEWLKEHNKRRKKYHERFGVSYRALKWSKFLKDQAQEWAEECARTGKFDHSWHLDIGENMAMHWGNGDKPASNILTRWTENEEDDPVPANGHMTQVLWRASEYVGCGEAKKGDRYYQVCQYSRPGNCNVSNSNYWERTMADSSGCRGMELAY